MKTKSHLMLTALFIGTGLATTSLAVAQNSAITTTAATQAPTTAITTTATTQASTTATTQNTRPDPRFHIELDYAYQLGLDEKLHGYNYDSEGRLGGHAVTLNALYNLNRAFTLGIGTGISGFNRQYNGNSTVVPLYAIVRYRPITTHRPFYTYAEVGHTLFNKSEYNNFSGGFLTSLGAGYQLMLKRHFGFNFRLGYNLQQFADLPIYDFTQEEAKLLDRRSLWRHSLQFGFGLVF